MSDSDAQALGDTAWEEGLAALEPGYEVSVRRDGQESAARFCGSPERRWERRYFAWVRGGVGSAEASVAGLQFTTPSEAKGFVEDQRAVIGCLSRLDEALLETLEEDESVELSSEDRAFEFDVTVEVESDDVLVLRSDASTEPMGELKCWVLVGDFVLELIANGDTYAEVATEIEPRCTVPVE